jgi:hypothetical protein
VVVGLEEDKAVAAVQVVLELAQVYQLPQEQNIQLPLALEAVAVLPLTQVELMELTAEIVFFQQLRQMVAAVVEKRELLV